MIESASLSDAGRQSNRNPPDEESYIFQGSSAERMFALARQTET